MRACQGLLYWMQTSHSWSNAFNGYHMCPFNIVHWTKACINSSMNDVPCYWMLVLDYDRASTTTPHATSKFRSSQPQILCKPTTSILRSTWTTQSSSTTLTRRRRTGSQRRNGPPVLIRTKQHKTVSYIYKPRRNCNKVRSALPLFNSCLSPFTKKQRVGWGAILTYSSDFKSVCLSTTVIKNIISYLYVALDGCYHRNPKASKRCAPQRPWHHVLTSAHRSIDGIDRRDRSRSVTQVTHDIRSIALHRNVCSIPVLQSTPMKHL